MKEEYDADTIMIISYGFNCMITWQIVTCSLSISSLLSSAYVFLTCRMLSSLIHHMQYSEIISIDRSPSTQQLSATTARGSNFTLTLDMEEANTVTVNVYFTIPFIVHCLRYLISWYIVVRAALHQNVLWALHVLCRNSMCIFTPVTENHS